MESTDASALFRPFGPSRNFFVPSNFMMATAYSDKAFVLRSEELIRGGRTQELLEFTRAKVKGAANRLAFLVELTVPVHEKRHFYDTLATSLGVSTFMRHWANIGVGFDLLQRHSSESKPITFPLRAWAQRGDCPQEIRDFLTVSDQVADAANAIFSTGEPRKATIAQEIPYDIFIGTAEADDGEPEVQIGERTSSDSFVFYPVSLTNLLESSATLVQLAVMDMHDQGAAGEYFSRLGAREDLWRYTSFLKLAFNTYGHDYHRILQILDFSLLTPPKPTSGNSVQRMQNHPEWRLRALLKQLGETALDGVDINAAAHDLCTDHGWMTPSDVITEMKRTYTEQVSRLLAAEDKTLESDPAGLVMKDFMTMVLKLLDIRQATPLLGMEYVRGLEESHIRPPLHRKRLESEPNDIRAEPGLRGQAWLTFLIIDRLLRDAIDGSVLRCPFGMDEDGAVFPGEGLCSCRIDEREALECLLFGFFKAASLHLQPLS